MKRAVAIVLALLFCMQAVFAGSTTASKLQPSHLEWHLSLTGAQSAWAQGADGHGVSVLVIDSGLDKVMATTALSGQILPSYAANPLHAQVSVPCKYYNPYAGCTKAVIVPDPTALRDDIGHGSFVLCEIVCNGQSYDYYGIAPKAKAAMAKVFGGRGGADSGDIAAAIRWGALYHFPIISMSLGSAMPDHQIGDAIAFAQSRGVIIVAAAGNSGNGELAYPAGFAGVVSVAATDRWDKRASFSQYGSGLSISAPGDFIFGIGPMHPTIINCAGLCVWEGTSMATPLVAGALADLLSYGLTPTQAQAALFGGARHWPGMDKNQYGNGILDLNGALAYAKAHD